MTILLSLTPFKELYTSNTQEGLTETNVIFFTVHNVHKLTGSIKLSIQTDLSRYVIFSITNTHYI